MAFDLAPAFVKINSRSVYAPHVQIVPTAAWNDGDEDGDFTGWTGSPVDARTMIEEFINLESEFYPPTYNFFSYEIWVKPAPGDIPVLVRARNVDIDGLAIIAGQSKATQSTWSFKTLGGNIMKVVNLDNVIADFNLITSAAVSGPQTAFIDAVTNVANAWSGRDNTRPFFFRQIANTLNEKLRREYFMT